jgi:hypothetical protein
MTTKIQDRTLTANDRCDSCGSQAYVHVEGMSGKLMFCAHHFSKIMSDPSGQEAMEKFAFKITDERSTLEN